MAAYSLRTIYEAYTYAGKQGELDAVTLGNQIPNRKELAKMKKEHLSEKKKGKTEKKKIETIRTTERERQAKSKIEFDQYLARERVKDRADRIKSANSDLAKVHTRQAQEEKKKREIEREKKEKREIEIKRTREIRQQRVDKTISSAESNRKSKKAVYRKAQRQVKGMKALAAGTAVTAATVGGMSKYGDNVNSAGSSIKDKYDDLTR